MRICGEKKKIPVKREENHWTDFELRMVNDLAQRNVFEFIKPLNHFAVGQSLGHDNLVFDLSDCKSVAGAGGLAVRVLFASLGLLGQLVCESPFRCRKQKSNEVGHLGFLKYEPSSLATRYSECLEQITFRL